MLLSLLLTPGVSPLCMYPHTYTFSSLVPWPPLFFCSSVCIQYNTQKRKSEKNGEDLVSSITCVMSGGHENDVRGRGPTAKTTHWITRSSALPQTLAWSKLLTFTGKKLALGVSSLHIWMLASPATSTDVTHVMDETRPSLFFTLFRFRVLYWMQTEKQKLGKAWERGYTFRYCLSCVSTHVHMVTLTSSCTCTRIHMITLFRHTRYWRSSEGNQWLLEHDSGGYHPGRVMDTQMDRCVSVNRRCTIGTPFLYMCSF